MAVFEYMTEVVFPAATKHFSTFHEKALVAFDTDISLGDRFPQAGPGASPSRDSCRELTFAQR